MQRKWLWAAFVLLLVATAAFSLLYTTKIVPIEEEHGVRLLRFGAEEKSEAQFVAERDPDIPKKELVVYQSTPIVRSNLGESGETGVGTIAFLTVRQISQDTVSVDGKNYPRINIVASLLKDDIPRTLTIPFINIVNVSNGSDEKKTFEETKVTNLILEPGQKISVSLHFIPEENPLSQRGIKKYCDHLKDAGCSYAAEQGWGTSPMDLTHYIDSIFKDGKETATISYQYAVPNIITTYD